MSDVTNGAPQPSSWRDVYQLVQDVEVRLTGRINDVGQLASHVGQDHEVRLRSIEAKGSSEAQEALSVASIHESRIRTLETGVGPAAQVASTTATANAVRIAALEAANIVQNAKAEGRSGVFSFGQKVIVMVVVVVNVVIAVISLIHR